MGREETCIKIWYVKKFNFIYLPTQKSQSLFSMLLIKCFIIIINISFIRSLNLILMFMRWLINVFAIFASIYLSNKIENI